VRALIKAVSSFTDRKVNVISYSLGGPISRKAIFGGRCVDTGEDLGGPLTDIVDAYLSNLWDFSYLKLSELRCCGCSTRSSNLFYSSWNLQFV
jgi:hypothetical protein